MASCVSGPESSRLGLPLSPAREGVGLAPFGACAQGLVLSLILLLAGGAGRPGSSTAAAPQHQTAAGHPTQQTQA